VVTLQTHAQAADVQTLMRRAGVVPLTATVTPASALLRSIAGPPADRVAPPPAPAPASKKPRAGGSGSGRSSGNGRSAASGRNSASGRGAAAASAGHRRRRTY
jgi:hypothetical protein